MPAVPAQRPGDGSAVLPITSAPVPRRRRNWRLILAVAAALLSTLCAAGSLTAYLWYDQATAPDLSTPTVVVRQWVTAYLVEHDDSRASLLTCSQTDLAEVKSLRDSLGDRQASYGIAIDVSLDTARELSREGQHATVRASIVLATDTGGTSLRRVESWDFDTTTDHGWRVCGAHKVG